MSQNKMLLKGKVALVTGGGRGIGRGIALGLAQAGAAVAVTARTEEEVNRVQQEMRALGAQALGISADMANPNVLPELVGKVSNELGSIDVLVNNAAVGSAYSQKPLIEYDDDFWDYSLALNLTTPYRLCKAVAPAMREKKWGRIINISSLAGKMPLLHGSAYAASKHGLIGLTRAIALELAPSGITVNAICPGPVKTRMGELRMTQDSARLGIDFDEWERRLTPPIGRLLVPEDFAPITVLLSSDAGAAITGQVINVCGGTMMS